MRYYFIYNGNFWNDPNGYLTIFWNATAVWSTLYYFSEFFRGYIPTNNIHVACAYLRVLNILQKASIQQQLQCRRIKYVNRIYCCWIIKAQLQLLAALFSPFLRGFCCSTYCICLYVCMYVYVHLCSCTVAVLLCKRHKRRTELRRWFDCQHLPLHSIWFGPVCHRPDLIWPC